MNKLGIFVIGAIAGYFASKETVQKKAGEWFNTAKQKVNNWMADDSEDEEEAAENESEE